MSTVCVSVRVSVHTISIKIFSEAAIIIWGPYFLSKFSYGKKWEVDMMVSGIAAFSQGSMRKKLEAWPVSWAISF